MSAPSLEVSTGLHGDVQSDMETSVGVTRGDGQLIVVVSPAESQVEVQTEASADAGLSLSLTGVQVGAEATGTASGGLSLR